MRPVPGWFRVGARRYGNTLLLLAGLALLTVLLPEVKPTAVTVGAAGEEVETGFVSTEEAAAQAAAEEQAAVEAGNGTGSATDGGTATGPGRRTTDSRAGGSTSTTAKPRQVVTKCRSDGRQWGISFHMPPCTPVFTGDNGGATSTGVARDKITVIRVVSEDPAMEAAARSIPGAGDEINATNKVQDVMLPYFNQHYETYGREVVLVDYRLTGSKDDPEGQRNDARDIAKRLKPFAVVAGNGAVLTPAFVEELGANGVICVNCSGWPFWRSLYTKYPGMLWSVFSPILDELYLHGAEYVGKRLAGRPAKWAGEAGMKVQTRTFGLIYAEGDITGPNAESISAKNAFVQHLATYGVTLTAEAGYQPTIPPSDARVAGAIGRVKGVTTIICLCDSFTTTAFTKEATRQQMFPEWFFPATRNMDINTAGRQYDQLQWEHAFGLSAWPMPSRSTANNTPYREYKHQVPTAKPGDEKRAAAGVSPTFGLLFTGIHMAGPKLTPATFAQGLYNYPATGGHPKEPLWDSDPDNPTNTRDLAEIWWDTQATGPDEIGDSTLPGLYRRVNFGKRYRLGEWPTTEPNLFNRNDPGAALYVEENTAAKEHEQDGHRHGPNPRCRSCI